MNDLIPTKRHRTEGKYILDENRNPVPVDTLEEWASRFERENRHVGHDTIGGMRISTVFLGLDHSFSSEGPPLLFETMVFGGEGSHLEDFCVRAATWDEALANHQAAVKTAIELRNRLPWWRKLLK